MYRDKLSQILDLARWAPSGDNTQPWRFELVNDQIIRIHGFDTRDHVIYDYEGHASHIAHGALLETIRIAATQFGLTANWRVAADEGERRPIYEVQFASASDSAVDALFPFIKTRTVQRRPMSTNRITDLQRNALVDAAGNTFALRFFEEPSDRLKIAKLLWSSAKIRLTCREAYPVHRDIIEWRAQFSKDRIPEQAIGVDPLTARLMEWALKSWDRVHFLNRFLLGTVAPRIQLDLLPGYFCGAHLLVKPSTALNSLTDWLALGGAIQRIWLTATKHGLLLQPQMTPVIFRWYVRSNQKFSSDERLFERSVKVTEKFERITDSAPASKFGFFCRLGFSTTPTSRSIRRDPSELMSPKVS